MEYLPLSKTSSTVSRGARLVMGLLGGLEGFTRRIDTEFSNASQANLIHVKAQISDLTTSLNQLVSSTQGGTISELQDRLGSEAKTRGKAQSKARATCPNDASPLADRLAKVPAKQ